uniref:Major facilitator superfamily domain-containing protein 6 n=1 Tax=Aceria tosichella TaxID=561515 RepID=A0A6G1SMC6_9ACAR
MNPQLKTSENLTDETMATCTDGQRRSVPQCTCNQQCLIHTQGQPKTTALSQIDLGPTKMCSGSADQSDTIEQASSNKANKNNSLINVPLIPLKMILFTWYAAGACLLPYMTLHMKQLGLNMAEMTAVYAILPIIQLLGTPIAGFIADKTGNYKSVLQLSLATCIVTTTLIQYAVPARKTSSNQPAVSTPPMSNATTSSMPTSGPSTTPASGMPDYGHEQDNTMDTLYLVTFWLYLFIRVFHQVAVGLSYVLLDTTTIVLAEQNNSSYGRQRFWAILATGVFSPICGFVIDNYSYVIAENGEKINNYDPAFYFFNALTLFTLIKASMIKVEISALPTNVWGNVMPLLKSANVWIFLFSVFIMGSCWGFLESFLFIYLKQLQAPNYLLGLTVTVGALIGLPFLYGSDWFVRKFGAVQLLIVALVVYFIRLVGYSYLNDPWWCIPYELMEAFTLHLMWVSTVQLAYQISPPGMLATLQAVVGGLNFGVGRGFGSLVGGSVIVFYGNRIAFRVVGSMALITAILYASLHYLFLQPLEVHDKKKVNRMIGGGSSDQLKRTNSLSSSKRRRQSAKDFEAAKDIEAC